MVIFKDLSLRRQDHDLERKKFDLVFVRGADAVTQRLKIRLSTFLGEWFLNRSAGVPYYEDALTKNPNLAIIEQEIRDQINTTPGVTDILEFNLEFDNLTRTLRIDTRVRLETNEIIQFGLDL